MKKLGLFIILGHLISCGPISFNRSYLNEMEEKETAFFKPGEQFGTVAGDDAMPTYTKEQMYKRTPDKEKIFPEMSEKERIAAELRNKVANMSEEQQMWFSQNEKLFSSDSQKVYFLNLNQDEQAQYLNNLGQSYIKSDAYRNPASYFSDSKRANGSISLGMDKASVIQMWGQPTRVEVAGNPRYENERWIFNEGGNSKYIYFASGKVEGWALE